MGDLRYRTNEQDGDGLWARYVGGKFGSGSFDGNYNLFQLGYDKADNEKSTYGFAIFHAQAVRMGFIICLIRIFSIGFDIRTKLAYPCHNVSIIAPFPIPGTVQAERGIWQNDQGEPGTGHV